MRNRTRWQLMLAGFMNCLKDMDIPEPEKKFGHAYFTCFEVRKVVDLGKEFDCSENYHLNNNLEVMGREWCKSRDTPYIQSFLQLEVHNNNMRGDYGGPEEFYALREIFKLRKLWCEFAINYCKAKLDGNFDDDLKGTTHDHLN